MRYRSDILEINNEYNISLNDKYHWILNSKHMRKDITLLISLEDNSIGDDKYLDKKDSFISYLHSLISYCNPDQVIYLCCVDLLYSLRYYKETLYQDMVLNLALPNYQKIFVTFIYRVLCLSGKNNASIFDFKFPITEITKNDLPMVYQKIGEISYKDNRMRELLLASNKENLSLPYSYKRKQQLLTFTPTDFYFNQLQLVSENGMIIMTERWYRINLNHFYGLPNFLYKFIAARIATLNTKHKITKVYI